MLRIGKGTEIRSLSTLPSGLKGDDALIFDALFTGGAAGTGIAGSKATGHILRDVINNPDIVVEITFGDLSQVPAKSAEGYTDPNYLDQNRIPIEILKSNKPEKGSHRYPSQMAKLRMVLNHELSHAHNFITNSHIFNPANFTPQARYHLELMSFDRDAQLAWEIRDANQPTDWHVRHSEFEPAQLAQRAAGNMGGSYRAKLMFLASYASDYFPPSP